MNIFWDNIIKPIIRKVNPKHIVEIGSDSGRNTKNIAEYCLKNSCKLSVIDPFPKYDIEQWEKKYEGKMKVYTELSLSRLPLLDEYEVILIDGDHNWYTVYNELKIIEKKFKNREKKFPMILFHDVGWPYAKRDLYYNPDNIPIAYRQAYDKKGISPDSTSLVEEGLNVHLYNAIYENNPKNGVLTAIEDFIEESKEKFCFTNVDAFHGLGIMVKENNVLLNDINEIISKSKESLLSRLELERINLQINANGYKEKSELLAKFNKSESKAKELLKEELIKEREAKELLEEELIKEREAKELLEEEIIKEREAKELLEEEIIKERETKELLEEEIIKEREAKELLEEEIIKERQAKKLLKENLIKEEKAEELAKDLDKEINEKNYKLEKENGFLKKENCEIKNNLSKNNCIIQEELNTKINKLENEKKELINNIEKYKLELNQSKIAENVHLNSVRYKIGDAIVKGAKPSKETLKIPFKVFRFYKEGKKKIKEREKNDVKICLNLNKNVNQIERQSIDKKEEIVNLNKKLISEYKFENTPKVSIVILNRNGKKHLETLFNSLNKNTIYLNYEMIILDNASTDNSVEFIRHNKKLFDITLIENKENESFSKANNRAVKSANGKYIVLMNNDIEPTYGWLQELMKVYIENENVGAVGCKLVYPEAPISEVNKQKSFKVQHVGISFREEKDFIRPYNMGNGLEPFDPSINHIEERAGVTAAVMLIRKDIYEEIDGLDERYVYGYEDVDINLKIKRKGYKIFYCPTALLFHHEFGTQSKDKNNDVRKRRLNNQMVFKNNWYHWLQKRILDDKTNNKKIFTEKNMKVGLVVTEYGPNSTAGDYFTALELGESMKKLGWEIRFLPRNGPENWYQLDYDYDLVVSLLESYNPKKIKDRKENLITIGWSRNWFDRWCDSEGFNSYNLFCASSETACKYVYERTKRKAYLLPIATNPKRFLNEKETYEMYKTDYVFTGSYWNDPREIIDILSPSQLPYKFKVFGMNWEKVPKLKKYHGGFVRYQDMPKIYNCTKIVIDDANRVTKPYGAVNSRVFDALGAGKLVLTNGIIGAEETFKGMLPYFGNKEQLNTLLKEYLEDDEKKEAKVKELQEFVFKYHTYDHRAREIKRLLMDEIVNKKKVAIKVPAPKWETVDEWGDYHFALAMEKEFIRKGYEVIIQLLPDWDNGEDKDCSLVVVLRGLSKYKPKNNHFNVMWNISHPDKVSIEEYNQYDKVFIASEKWAKHIKEICKTDVEALLQCSDPELFNTKYKEDKNKYELLFVGNSRKIFRKIVKDLLPTDKNLAVYGTNWRKIIDPKYIKGEHIPNKELSNAYSNCKILLNDHWDDMREKGFISNRLFDGLASGAFIISDEIQEAKELFNGAIVTYTDKEDLNNKVNYYLENDNERKNLVKRGNELVLKNHTFKNRVEKIIECTKI